MFPARLERRAVLTSASPKCPPHPNICQKTSPSPETCQKYRPRSSHSWHRPAPRPESLGNRITRGGRRPPSISKGLCLGAFLCQDGALRGRRGRSGDVQGNFRGNGGRCSGKGKTFLGCFVGRRVLYMLLGCVRTSDKCSGLVLLFLVAMFHCYF